MRGRPQVWAALVSEWPCVENSPVGAIIHNSRPSVIIIAAIIIERLLPSHAGRDPSPKDVPASSQCNPEWVYSDPFRAMGPFPVSLCRVVAPFGSPPELRPD